MDPTFSLERRAALTVENRRNSRGRSSSPQRHGKSAYTASGVVPATVPHNSDASWGIGGGPIPSVQPYQQPPVVHVPRPSQQMQENAVPTPRAPWWSFFDCTSGEASSCMGACSQGVEEMLDRSTQPQSARPGIGASFLVSSNSEVCFQTAVPGSASWDAMQQGELIEGDVLAEVDGLPVHRSPIRLVAPMLAGEPGSFVRVSFRRGTKVFSLDLERRLLGQTLETKRLLGTHSASSSLQGHRKGGARKKYDIDTSILDRAGAGQEFYRDMSSNGKAKIACEQITNVYHSLQKRLLHLQKQEKSLGARMEEMMHKIQDTAYLSHDKKQTDVEQLHVARDKYHFVADNMAIAQQDLHRIKELMTQAMHEEKVADLGDVQRHDEAEYPEQVEDRHVQKNARGSTSPSSGLLPSLPTQSADFPRERNRRSSPTRRSGLRSSEPPEDSLTAARHHAGVSAQNPRSQSPVRRHVPDRFA